MKTKKTVSKSAKIRALLAKGMKPAAVAKKLGVKVNLVYQIQYQTKKRITKVKDFIASLREPERTVFTPDAKVWEVEGEGEPVAEKVTSDLVNHPPHYKAGGIETIDFIEAKDLNYRLGNVVKYVSRAGKKIDSDPLKDLKKAAWYLQREIDVREKA